MKSHHAVVVLTHLFVAVLAFQLGLFYSFHKREINWNGAETKGRLLQNQSEDCTELQEQPQHHHHRGERLQYRRTPPWSNMVPSSLTKLLAGVATVNLHDFLASFPFGFPLFGRENPKLSKFGPGNRNILLLYQHHAPNVAASAATASQASKPNNSNNNATQSMPINVPTNQYISVPSNQSVSQALQPCRVVNHIMTHLGTMNDRNAQSCLALVGRPHTPSYSWFKYMRSDVNGSTLKPVARYIFRERWNVYNGLLKKPPTANQMRSSLKVLNDYLQHYPKALKALKPIAQRVAQAGNIPNTIIVLVCNFGHAELFVNFVCAAKAAKLDLSKLLLFATDVETHELAQSLGVASFHDANIFASIPRGASLLYGDDDYSKIMMSKVYCVHMISQLGYNFLFQDVDIMIYQPNYLDWFVEKAHNMSQFDLFFQHDFNERSEYAPWISNSGCYYAVNNARTQQLFTDMVYHGDKILAARSHQAVLHTVLSEMNSQYALRSKTLRDDHSRLPIGWHYQTNVEFMRELVKQGKSQQLSFHMNWNTHKGIKREYLEQMGDWYVQDPCTGEQTVAELRNVLKSSNIMESCCSATPLIRCHYRDKPSVIPCRDSPPEQNGSTFSFW